MILRMFSSTAAVCSRMSRIREPEEEVETPAYVPSPRRDEVPEMYIVFVPDEGKTVRA